MSKLPPKRCSIASSNNTELLSNDKFVSVVESFGEIPPTNALWIPVNLEQSVIDTVQESIPKGFKQAQRLFCYLAKTKDGKERVTKFCNMKTSTSNLSDVARKLNPYLWKHCLQISCQKPSVLGVPQPKNQFGEKTDEYVWSIYHLRDAANDGVH